MKAVDENPEKAEKETKMDNESKAYCHACKAWTPMKWLPKEQRGKRAETWFECAVCGGRHLELRYLTESEAKAKNKAAR